MSGNDEKCPFSNVERMDKTDDEEVEGMMKRIEVNDDHAMFVLDTFMTREKDVCCRIRRGQTNYGNTPRSLVPVRRISPWVACINMGEI